MITALIESLRLEREMEEAIIQALNKIIKREERNDNGIENS